MRSLDPFGLIAGVDEIERQPGERPWPGAGSVKIGNGLIKELEEIVVNLELRIEVRRRRDNCLPVRNVAPDVRGVNHVHRLQDLEDSFVHLIGDGISTSFCVLDGLQSASRVYVRKGAVEAVVRDRIGALCFDEPTCGSGALLYPLAD